jgi:hypothetical protein
MGLEDTAKLIDWDKRLKEQYSRGWDNYIRRRIYLDVARDLDCWGICGEFLYVEDVSSAAAAASIRLNRNTNDTIDLALGTVVKTIFCQIFITHAALQAEWIDIIYGINFEYYKEHPTTVAVLPLPAGASTSALQLPDGHNVTVDNAGGAAAVNIQDGGNAITVDAAALPLPAGAATSALQLPDGHNVTVDNAGGGAAVNIQDGGNAITVDAAALPLPAGASTSALQLPDGHNVTVDNAAGAAAVNIQDGGNAITVDGSVTAVDNGIAQPCIIITNAAADANTVGANHACKRVLIRAHTINTGLVWVDFNNAAVALACYPLDKGDSISVPLTNTNLINCLFKVANEKVTVVYTN